MGGYDLERFQVLAMLTSKNKRKRKVEYGLIRIEAFPRRFGQKESKIKKNVACLLFILHERRKNGTSCYPVLKSDIWGV